MSKKIDYDFSGWATRHNIKCSDGRTILKNAFAHNDGSKVPLVWNHQHNDPNNILGHAYLENKSDGVYAYCKFNNSETGKAAKILVMNGDIDSLSIYANNLQHGHSKDVKYGNIREVSMVVSGANPGAYIDYIMKHDGITSVEEAIILTGKRVSVMYNDDFLNHGETNKHLSETIASMSEDQLNVLKQLMHMDKEQNSDENENKKNKKNENKTISEIIETMNEEQQKALYALVGAALEDGEDDDDDKNDDGGNDMSMKQNAFEMNRGFETKDILQHSDKEKILTLAKSASVGSLRSALEIYASNEELSHGFDDIDVLFPDIKDLKPGAPDLITDDDTWVKHIMSKIHKTPYSRIRTKQVDIREDDTSVKGYTKGDEKANMNDVLIRNRTTEPQTIYIKDDMHRDDIIDITDFDIIAYQWLIMRKKLEEEIVRAMTIGDGRAADHADKISPTNLRPIWTDDELYAIHSDVDFDQAKKDIQGTNTALNFSENYIQAEAVIMATLYAMEEYKGSGNCDFYCAPHLLNTMLLARDLNGRRIYESKSDLAKALNVNNIYTADVFTNKTRVTKDATPLTKKLLGIIVNVNDYNLGATKGGEISKFDQFDIDFNRQKFLMETRLSGALTKIKSAIVLEEDITVAG